MEVTTEVQQAVETTVFTSAIIKKEFKSSKIVEIKTSTTELVTSYQVTVVNADNQTAVVDLVEEVGQPISIINVRTDIVSAVVVAKEETVKTEVVVQAITGNKIVVTNDQLVIKTDTSVTHVTQNIFSQVPALIGWAPVSVSTTTYDTIKETTIVMQSSDSTLTQVTTIVNTLTNTVQVVNTQVVQPAQKPMVLVIPSTFIKTAVKKFTELQSIITTIESSAAVVIFDSVTVQELNDIRIITTVVSYPSTV